MYTSYAYMGLVNDQRKPLKSRYGSRSKPVFTPQNAKEKISTVNPLLKFVTLLHTKSDEKLPHDNISHFLFLEVARCYNLSCTCTSAMHFGPSTLLF